MTSLHPQPLRPCIKFEIIPQTGKNRKPRGGRLTKKTAEAAAEFNPIILLLSDSWEVAASCVESADCGKDRRWKTLSFTGDQRDGWWSTQFILSQHHPVRMILITARWQKMVPFITDALWSKTCGVSAAKRRDREQNSAWFLFYFYFPRQQLGERQLEQIFSLHHFYSQITDERNIQGNILIRHLIWDQFEDPTWFDWWFAWGTMFLFPFYILKGDKSA